MFSWRYQAKLSVDCQGKESQVILLPLHRYKWILGPYLRGISCIIYLSTPHCYLGSIFSPVLPLLQLVIPHPSNFLYTTTIRPSIVTTLVTHHSSLQSVNIQCTTSSSHDTTHSSLLLQILHTHWHPDNNRLSAVALLRAWDLCYSLHQSQLQCLARP